MKKNASKSSTKAPVRRVSSRKPAAKAAARGAQVKSGPQVRLPRVAKGKKPQYFSDPAIDKLLWMNLTLMEELSVTRDRLDTLERLLDGKRLLRLREIEAYVPVGTAAAERTARRNDYVERVLRAASAELEESRGATVQVRSDEEALAAVDA